MTAMAPLTEPWTAPEAAGRWPDVRSFRHRFGLIVPATNTSMEHELWSIVFANQAPGGLRGAGLHTSAVVTPRPLLRDDADRRAYGRQFLRGLRDAVRTALLAEPHSLILGMSLEHVLPGLEAVRAPLKEVAAESGLWCAAWPDAARAALERFASRRIGLLTPFDGPGTASAARMFADLGYDVVASVGLACGDARHIARVPDWVKERAILEHLATDGHRLDAVVQCGTNMSLLDVTERLEPRLGIPVIGINACLFWWALRRNGFSGPLLGGGRLLREF